MLLMLCNLKSSGASIFTNHINNMLWHSDKRDLLTFRVRHHKCAASSPDYNTDFSWVIRVKKLFHICNIKTRKDITEMKWFHYTPMWKVCVPPAVCLNIPRECSTYMYSRLGVTALKSLYINSLYHTVVSNIFVYVTL